MLILDFKSLKLQMCPYHSHCLNWLSSEMEKKYSTVRTPTPSYSPTTLENESAIFNQNMMYAKPGKFISYICSHVFAKCHEKYIKSLKTFYVLWHILFQHWRQQKKNHLSVEILSITNGFQSHAHCVFRD